MTLVAAAAVSLPVTLLAWRLNTVTASGGVAAFAVGVAVLWGGSWPGGMVLASFFISSNLVARATPDLAGSFLDAKGQRRDPFQVLANGGVAAAGALIERNHPGAGAWTLTASLATAAADTWATSLGALNPLWPRLLAIGKQVPPGTSGGMSWYGTGGAAAGAVLVAGTGALAFHDTLLLPVATGVGFVGMVLDSAAGALIQARYHCPACEQPCERPLHRCGARAVLIGGIRWLNNDGINALATLAGGFAGWLAWAWASP